MKKLIETLRSLGIQIPKDREEAVRRTLSENYKNIKEVAKIRKRLGTHGCRGPKSQRKP